GNQTGEAFLSDLALFLLAIVVGVFMIRSGIKEANQKELLARLNTELDDLNRNLQKKVDEQTKEIRTAYEVEKEAHRRLIELDKEKNDFILAAQHNLRTPLTVARGYAQEINSRLGEGRTEEIPSFMSKTIGALDTMGQLVNGLLDITSLEVGKGGFNKEKEVK
ncbi:MAG: histidine kinase dimerization/phospho-acceptor domain-containing protein, partial [Patescibacteria group bacterium]